MWVFSRRGPPLKPWGYGTTPRGGWHARYAAEVVAGMHGKGKGKKAGGSRKVVEEQLGLFGEA